MGTGTARLPGGGGPSRPPPRASVNLLVPLLLTGVRHHPPGRTDKNLCRCFGAPACRIFPDHLITLGQLHNTAMLGPQTHPTQRRLGSVYGDDENAPRSQTPATGTRPAVTLPELL